MNHYWHWGQLGDIVYALPTVKLLGPGKLTTSILRPRLHFMYPLLSRHFTEVRHDDRGRMNHWSYQPVGVTHDLNIFRATSGGKMHLRHLALQHADPWGLTPDLTVPWIEPDPSWERAKYDRVVIARSPRYRHPKADWWRQWVWIDDGRPVWPRYPEVVFVGHEAEYVDLCVGRHHRCADAWEMCRLIYESKAFYGNQSMPLALAEGLGVPHHIELDGVCTNTVIPNHPLQQIIPCPTGASPIPAGSASGSS